jgi:hypothetical protein
VSTLAVVGDQIGAGPIILAQALPKRFKIALIPFGGDQGANEGLRRFSRRYGSGSPDSTLGLSHAAGAFAVRPSTNQSCMPPR